MSKNTKIIAIVGGVLIIVLVLYSALSKGGCSGAIDAWKGVLGCQSKKKVSNKKGHSRDFCVQHPNDPACKANTTKKAGDDEADDEEEARPARPAPRGDAARPAAGAPARPAGGMAADDDDD